MILRRFIKSIPVLMVAFSTLGGLASAETVQPSEVVAASSSAGHVEIDRTQPSATQYQVNSEGKIAKEIIDYLDGSKEVITYIYNSDGSIEKKSEITGPSPGAITEEKTAIQGEALDDYIYDQRIKNQLAALTTAYGLAENEYNSGSRTLAEKNAIQAEVNNLANVARADYIIMNPYSEYAQKKLGGTRSYPLSRNLSYNETSPLSGIDVMVIQRRLLLSEFLELPDSADYGIYGPLTEEAVRTFQRLHGLTEDGVVGPQTYAAMFSSKNSNIRNFAALSMISIYRQKHNLVQMAATHQIKINRNYGECTTYANVCMEVTVPGGGITGGYGFADIVDKNRKMVWEVKPDNPRWNEVSSKGAVQLQRYINASAATQQPYFPLTQGSQIAPFSVNWSSTEYLAVRTGRPQGTLFNYQSGMIYYETKTKNKSQPVGGPVVVANESTQKQKMPDVQTVSVAAGTVAGGYVIYRIGKTIIGILLVPVSGPVGVGVILAP